MPGFWITPRFISHEERPFGRLEENNPILWGLTMTMVINHLPSGMILQVLGLVKGLSTIGFSYIIRPAVNPLFQRGVRGQGGDPP